MDQAKNNRFLNYPFRSLYEQSKQNCFLLMDTEGIVISVNESFTKCFGYSREEIEGKSASILFTPADLEKGMFIDELKKTLECGESKDNNYLVNKDQTITWVTGESVLTKTDDGEPFIIKIIQDINQRKTSELALQSLNDFNENILASIEDAVIVLDADLNLIKANNGFKKLFKASSPDLNTLNIAELIKPYDKNNNLLESIKNTITTRESFSNSQIELEVFPGQKRYFDVLCKPLPGESEDHVLLIVHDITLHKQLEREREDIMGFVAHELRNPMANIILCNDIMTDALQNNEKRLMYDMLEKTKNNVRRLQKMISELYEATIVNSGFLNLEISVFHFGDMIKEAVETIEVLQPAYNIIVEGDSDFKINADRHRLIQVVTNLLSNGIKYSNGETDVLLTVSHDENSATVAVHDKGVGISKQMLPFIFERFFRVQKTRNIEGIGLGLYLCQQIVLAHNGKIWAESNEGEGSTFYFTIPLNFNS